MTPQAILQHHDTAQLWPAAPSREGGFDLAAAYQAALAVRALRAGRGERPRGYKIGFTNRTIWDRYGVHAPIWGTVWESALQFSEPAAHAEATVEVPLAGTCQPRIEPETVFGLKATPPAGATLQQLFESIEWLAPGFEVVQSHLPDWKFAAPDTVADGGLHARLLVGERVPLRQLADSAAALDTLLAGASVTLERDGQPVEDGRGAHVLDSPLRALHHFLAELRQCPGAPDLQPGDLVTTGTWTDAWPVAPGQEWRARFSRPLRELALRFG